MLYISYNWFTPAYKSGGPTQSLQQLSKHISNEKEIRIICSSLDHDGSILSVTPNHWVPISQKLLVWYSTTTSLIRWIKFIRQQPAKVWFINGIYSLKFNLIPLIFGKGNKVISSRGMLDPGSLSQKSLKKKIYLFFLKLLGFHKFCRFHATCLLEEKNIRSIFGEHTKVSIISNIPRVFDYAPMPMKEFGILRLVTVALINPVKNYLLVLEALKDCGCTIQYDIYGPIHHEKYWEQCLNVIETMPANIKVIYHGDIHPNEVAPVLANAHIYIQPSRSENFGHSIFEAFSAGRPVITSFQTPWQDLLKHNAGKNVTITETKEITEALESFAAMDQSMLHEWSLCARQYAENMIDINQFVKEYKNMFEI